MRLIKAGHDFVVEPENSEERETLERAADYHANGPRPEIRDNGSVDWLATALNSIDRSCVKTALAKVVPPLTNRRPVPFSVFGTGEQRAELQAARERMLSGGTGPDDLKDGLKDLIDEVVPTEDETREWLKAGAPVGHFDEDAREVLTPMGELIEMGKRAGIVVEHPHPQADPSSFDQIVEEMASFFDMAVAAEVRRVYDAGGVTREEALDIAERNLARKYFGEGEHDPRSAAIARAVKQPQTGRG